MTFSSTVSRPEEPEVLEGAHEAQVRHALGRRAARGTVGEAHVAGGRREAAAQHAEESRLAGAVRPDDGHDLAFVDDEVDILHGGETAEPAAEMPRLEERHQAACPARAASARAARGRARHARRHRDDDHDDERAVDGEAVRLECAQVLRQERQREPPRTGPSVVPMPPTSTETRTLNDVATMNDSGDTFFT